MSDLGIPSLEEIKKKADKTREFADKRVFSYTEIVRIMLNTIEKRVDGLHDEYDAKGEVKNHYKWFVMDVEDELIDRLKDKVEEEGDGGGDVFVEEIV